MERNTSARGGGLGQGQQRRGGEEEEEKEENKKKNKSKNKNKNKRSSKWCVFVGCGGERAAAHAHESIILTNE